MKYVVELNDDDGNSFQVEMKIPFISSGTDTKNSTWKTLDKGFIKYHSGGCYFGKTRVYCPTDIYLLMNGVYGIQFFELFDEWGLVNSSGKGKAEQAWVVSFKPGGFGWTLIS